ncbi:NDR1/HIN1-like protein 13 [Malania oleifera]|uniref:NDR1/HIN1-like protein 13 n=1 Tax=Malania oleifera TaxID=397392 RepID=UPI0025AE836E|nr:NDR1/HIN1-like protein 13 [Malania oleifera]
MAAYPLHLTSPEIAPATPDSPVAYSPADPPLAYPPAGPLPGPVPCHVLVPKEQILYVPSLANASLAEDHLRWESRRRLRNRRRMIRCLLIAVFILACSVVAVLDAVFRPKDLKFSVERVSVEGFSSLATAAAVELAVRAENPSKHVGLNYRVVKVDIYYFDTGFGNGAVSPFYQPSKNVTVLRTVLRCSYNKVLRKALLDEHGKGRVPLSVTMVGKVNLKVSFIKTWLASVNIMCKLEISALEVKSNILSKSCEDYVKFW